MCEHVTVSEQPTQGQRAVGEEKNRAQATADKECGNAVDNCQM